MGGRLFGLQREVLQSEFCRKGSCGMGGGGHVGSAFRLQSKMCSPSLSLSGFLPISLCELWVGECLYPWGSAGGNTNKHRRLLPLCGSVLCWRDSFVPSQWVCQLALLLCVCWTHQGLIIFWRTFLRSLPTHVFVVSLHDLRADGFTR